VFFHLLTTKGGETLGNEETSEEGSGEEEEVTRLE
jgi:hypothetical protein